MHNQIHTIFAFILMLVLAFISYGQTVGNVKPSLLAGDVVSVEAGKIVFATKDGQMAATLSAETEFKKIPPDNRKMSAAVPAAITDIEAGDKIVVSGFPDTEKKIIPARTVYLMSKSELAAAKAKELERWRTHGISGRVTKVDQVTGQITIDVTSLGSTTKVVLSPKEKAKFLRYAPNSVAYSEAVASNILDVSIGDMLRAVGDRSPDGASFAAEEILTGAFQTHAGTVKSIDAAKNEVVITELQSKKDVIVSLGSASMMKKFPEQMAQMLAARQGGPEGSGEHVGGQAGGGSPRFGGQGGGQPGGQPPRSGGQGGQGGQSRFGGAGGPGGMGGGQRGSIDEMLERFPNITAADLKVGDMIAVSSTKTNSLDHITAIKLLAGVEPFVRMAQMSAAGNRSRGGSQSLNIPGLDGFDSP